MSSWADRAKVRFSQERQNSTAKTAETPLLAVLAVPPKGFCENTNGVLAVLAVPTEANPEKTHSDLVAANDPKPTTQTDGMALPTDDTDRWCWPASDAMNGNEIDLFAKRVDLFFYRDLPLPDAKSLADKLVKRDRDGDDRRVCLECKHLADIGGTWRCNNWQAAGVAVHQRDTQLPADLVLQLLRCSGFSERTPT